MSFATFAGGCFWCLVPPFEDIKGVKRITSGYANSNIKNPTYNDVAYGKDVAIEAVQIEYDEKQVKYKELLDLFWRQIDPTDGEGQFADRGSEYHTAIFYHDDMQKQLAEKSKKDIQKYFDEPIATKVIKFRSFYPAEDYHQDFYKKNPFRYNMYKVASGRAGFLREKWKR